MSDAEKREGSGQRAHKLINQCIQANLSATARHILHVLLVYENADRLAWPSMDRIADDCGLQRKAVRSALTALGSAGLIEVVAPRSGGESTRYRVMDTASLPHRGFKPLPTRWKGTIKVSQGNHGATGMGSTMVPLTPSHGPLEAPCMVPQEYPNDSEERCNKLLNSPPDGANAPPDRSEKSTLCQVQAPASKDHGPPPVSPESHCPSLANIAKESTPEPLLLPFALKTLLRALREDALQELEDAGFVTEKACPESIQRTAKSTRGQRKPFQVQLPTVAENHVPSQPSQKALKPEKPGLSLRPKGPLPFTLEAFLEAFHETSKGTALVNPFDRSLASALTSTVRALGEAHCTLDDVRLVGELWAAQEGDNWHGRGIDLRRISLKGFMTGQVATARKWDANGRPSSQRPSRIRDKPPPIPREQLGEDYEELWKRMCGETGSA